LYPCEGYVEPDTIFLVQSSLDHIAARSREFGERFYAIFFETYPELRPLFQNNLAAQTKMIMFMGAKPIFLATRSAWLTREMPSTRR